MKDMYFDVRIFMENMFEVFEDFDVQEDTLLALDLWALAWHGKKKSDMEEFGLFCSRDWCSIEEPKPLRMEEIDDWKGMLQ